MPVLARAPRQLEAKGRLRCCLTACCLEHRKEVFLQGWPEEDAGKWCHSAGGWPCGEDPADGDAGAAPDLDPEPGAWQCGAAAVPRESGTAQLLESVRFGPLTQAARRMEPGRWHRIAPGCEGRLLIVAGGAHPCAWIDVRPERPAKPRAATLFDDGDAA